MKKNALSVHKTLTAGRVIFWDFDGVIKDSVSVKAEAFSKLFERYGNEVVVKVKSHHESNGGMSRFDKIPLYLSWSGEPATPEQVEIFCVEFSKSVLQAVIDSPWVPGIREYLQEYFDQQYFVLVSATPQEEIEQILYALELTHFFREVYGAPTNKSFAIKEVVSRLNCQPTKALMIGDSEMDLHAAQVNSVPFLLRCTSLNLSLQASYNGPKFDCLNDDE